jgi:hypothetical protein
MRKEKETGSAVTPPAIEKSAHRKQMRFLQKY